MCMFDKNSAQHASPSEWQFLLSDLRGVIGTNGRFAWCYHFTINDSRCIAQALVLKKRSMVA